MIFSSSSFLFSCCSQSISDISETQKLRVFQNIIILLMEAKSIEMTFGIPEQHLKWPSQEISGIAQAKTFIFTCKKVVWYSFLKQSTFYRKKKTFSGRVRHVYQKIVPYLMLQKPIKYINCNNSYIYFQKPICYSSLVIRLFIPMQ